MTRKKKVGIVVLVLLVILVIAAYLNRNLIRILRWNIFPRKVELDTSTEWSGGKTYEKVQYSDVSESDYLNLYVPDSEEPMPLFVLIHGGGFVFNDAESRQPQFMYRYFRDHGYACASINYRLAQEAAYPGALDDVKAAIRFLKANAETYGYDASKVAVWGESAGGYLAVMAGVTNDEDFHGITYIGEEEAETPANSDVQVVVDYYGAVGLGLKDDGFDELGIPKIVQWAAGLWLDKALKGTGYDYVESYWLREDLNEASDERLYEISAYKYIEANLNESSDLRMLIWHGDADLDVPYTQSQELAERLGAVIGEDKVTMKLFHNYKHADDALYSDENLNEVKAYLDEAFAK